MRYLGLAETGKTVIPVKKATAFPCQLPQYIQLSYGLKAIRVSSQNRKMVRQ